jgi:lipoprotein signal peptidase
MSLTRKSILIILLILVADQTLKILVKTHMTLYQQIPFFGNWGILHFVENNGMAFGLSLPGELGKILLTSFRIVAVIAIGFYLRRLISIKAHTGLIITLSMVMAGALGNIIDSVFYGLIFSSQQPGGSSYPVPRGRGLCAPVSRKGGRYVLLPHSSRATTRIGSAEVPVLFSSGLSSILPIRVSRWPWPSSYSIRSAFFITSLPRNPRTKRPSDFLSFFKFPVLWMNPVLPFS